MAKTPASAVPVQPPANPLRNPVTPLNQTNPNSKDKSMDRTATLQRTPPAGSVPSTPLPTTWNPGYPTSGPTTQMPNPTDTASLPMFNGTSGNIDSGVGHSGDLGGAGAK
jgi:hypothetical protein